MELPDSEVIISGEVTAECLARARQTALKHMAEDAEVPGFRKGRAPEKVILERVGEMAVLEHAAKDALEEVYPEIIADYKLSPISAPEITITKIAAGNPLGFKMKIAVMPEVKLPDYKKVSADASAKIKPEPTDVTNDEVEKVITELQKNYARAGKPVSEKDAPEKLPEITDEFVKIFGNFKSVEDFKTSIKENLKKEKEFKEKDRRRLAISETLLDKTKVATPKILVESELARMIARFKDDIANAGLKHEDYLKQIKKTEEDIRKEWREGAEKKAKFQLILTEIARAEKISPAEEDVKRESAHILEHHKDVSENQVRSYIEMILTNEKVLNFLENLK